MADSRTITDWCSILPVSGSNNGRVNVSTIPHTGRLDRQAYITFLVGDKTMSVTGISQAAKAEFVIFYDAPIVSNKGGEIAIRGMSNSPRLSFELGDGDIPIVLPETYTVDGYAVNTGERIPNDPGANKEYGFAIKISIPPSEITREGNRAIIALADNGEAGIVVITQVGEDYVYINGSPSLAINVNDDMQDLVLLIQSSAEWQIDPVNLFWVVAIPSAEEDEGQVIISVSKNLLATPRDAEIVFRLKNNPSIVAILNILQDEAAVAAPWVLGTNFWNMSGVWLNNGVWNF
jgi:hypothetical protein